jgi:beta-glucosidase
VYPPGGNAVRGLSPEGWPGPVVYAPSSPLEALRAELPHATVSWADAADVAAAGAAAARADVAVVFVTQWTAESRDFPITLPDGQDALVEAVAKANSRTIVVLETGGPVLMPWAPRVKGVVEAWYPGTRGGPAIARVLSGAVNPSGRLPASFPRRLEDLPRSKIYGVGSSPDITFDVRYDEGAAVGYRWYDQRRIEPLFPFGHGLSYTTFARDKLAARVEGEELRVTFRVKNTGPRAGHDVAQIYVSPVSGGWEAPKRLGAFAKVALEPGASQDVTVTVEPRLLAVWDGARGRFRVAPGQYRVALASSARDAGKSVTVKLGERLLR